jgi:hypothetical protein
MLTLLGAWLAVSLLGGVAIGKFIAIGTASDEQIAQCAIEEAP